MQRFLHVTTNDNSYQLLMLNRLLWLVIDSMLPWRAFLTIPIIFPLFLLLFIFRPYDQPRDKFLTEQFIFDNLS